MDDDIDVILQDRRIRLHQQRLDKPIFTACTGALLLGVYRLWTVFALPGFRKVPISLKVALLMRMDGCVFRCFTNVLCTFKGVIFVCIVLRQ